MLCLRVLPNHGKELSRCSGEGLLFPCRNIEPPLRDLLGKEERKELAPLHGLLCKVLHHAPDAEIPLCELHDLKGEMVLIIEGQNEEKEVSLEDLLKEVKEEIKAGMRSKEAISTVAKKYNVSKNSL